MATIALISDFITTAEREAALNRYFALVEEVHAAGNTAEPANRLALSAYWNSDPTIRPRLTEAATEAQYVEGLTISECRLNSIAATIYTEIDKSTGRYKDIA